MTSNQFYQLFRRLRRNPLFSIVTLLTVALAVGANSAIFSVVNGILLKPLPYPQPDRLIATWLSAPGIKVDKLVLAPCFYFIFREQGRSWDDIGLWTEDLATITGRGVPERVDALEVTDGTLPILGAKPLLGRLFTRRDDSPASPESVVLTSGYWKRRFGGAPNIIGQRLLVNGVSHEVIGVLPETFCPLGSDPQLILPMRLNRNQTYLGNFSFYGVARLKPGVAISQANAEMARLVPVTFRSFPAFPGFSVDLFEKARISPASTSLMEDTVGDIGKTLWSMMASIAIVLLIACANLANLLLVRAEGRRQEIAVRFALGANARQVAAELISESIGLGIAGGLLGLALTAIALRVLPAIAPPTLPRLKDITIDSHVLLFTLLISLFAGLLFGSLPVLKFSRSSVSNNLRQGGRTLSQGRERHRARGALVIIQVALALVLLISSGLMIRTSRALLNVQPGFRDPATLQTMAVFIPESDVKEPARVLQMQAEILRRVESIPGVTSAIFSSSVPMDGSNRFDPIFREDHPDDSKSVPPVRRFKFVTPGSFKTLGTPLLLGRDFSWSDLNERRDVGILSENLARELWGDPRAAIGKRVRVDLKDPWREIIGVVGDTYDEGVNQNAPKIVYWPAIVKNFEGEALSVRRPMTLVVRTGRAGSESLIKQMEAAVWSQDPNVAAANVRTVAEVYRKSMARTTFTLVIFSTAGAMALLLGVIGIYGVIAYSVAQRTREIGIRLALGAQHHQLSAMFLRQGLVLTLCGIVCGLSVAYLVLRLTSSLLFGVTAVDPTTYISVSAGLLAVAALAAYIPSRKATQVDPSCSLQAE